MASGAGLTFADVMSWLRAYCLIWRSAFIFSRSTSTMQCHTLLLYVGNAGTGPFKQSVKPGPRQRIVLCCLAPTMIVLQTTGHSRCCLATNMRVALESCQHPNRIAQALAVQPVFVACVRTSNVAINVAHLSANLLCPLLHRLFWVWRRHKSPAHAAGHASPETLLFWYERHDSLCWGPRWEANVPGRHSHDS